MAGSNRWALVAGLVALLLAGCAAPGPGAGQPGGEVARPTGPKRIIAGIMSDPQSLYPLLNDSSIRGGEVIEELANSGLAVVDSRGSLRPQLAEAVPSVDNGLWRLTPDGRAETTWKLKEGTHWHDGTPFTSFDLVFTVQLLRDKELNMTRAPAYDFIDVVEAPDSRTVMVKWRAPYIEADEMFTRGLAFPIARHVFDAPYQRDKASLTGLPQWSVEYVGTGPFKLKDWVVGTHMVFTANDAYVLGRPKLDEIEIKFIPDPNTIFANVLGGGIETTLGKTVAIEQALEAQNVWREGRIDVAPGNAVVLRVQFLYAHPPIVLQLPFRQAMEHATNKKEMVDALLGGLAPPGETSIYSTREPAELAPARDRVVRYPYDPRRAMQLIDGLGYTRGSDGMYRDSAGQRISVEIRTNIVDLNQKAALTLQDMWRQVGVEGTLEVFPQSRASDQEYRAKFPAFELLRGVALDSVGAFHSRNRKTAENNWRGGNGGYGNPEYDALVDRYLVTIPIQERVRLLGDILHHLSDEVVVMVLFWDVEPILVGNRMQGLTARHRGSSHAWNAIEWDVRNSE